MAKKLDENGLVSGFIDDGRNRTLAAKPKAEEAAAEPPTEAADLIQSAVFEVKAAAEPEREAVAEPEREAEETAAEPEGEAAAEPEAEPEA
eukprot:SAG11_NODE_3343_length_2511_cov_1.277778_3_plen_91_part_00